MIRTHTSRGFALVLVLVLLGFVSVLIISLGLITRVETQISSSRDEWTKGRVHALFALDQALSHLQRTAGPDARVTARSDLLGGASAAYLTGVWSAEPGEARLLTWLVSGNHGESPLAVTPGTIPSPVTSAQDNEVFLIDRGSVATAAQRLKVLKEPIHQSADWVPAWKGADRTFLTAGHFAYWIGDEGIKVSLAMTETTHDVLHDDRKQSSLVPSEWPVGTHWEADESARMRLKQMRLSRPCVEMIFAGLDPDSRVGGSQSPHTRLSRLLTLPQLPMVSPVLSLSRTKAVFHDVTPLSYAVPIDLSASPARLRRDLSDVSDIASLAIRRRSQYRPFSDFGGEVTARIAARVEDEVASGVMGSHSVGPVVTEGLLRCRLSRDDVAQELVLWYEFQLEVWNPYSVGLQWDQGSLQLKITGLPSPIVSYQGRTWEVDLGAQLGEVALDALTLKPGEVRVLRGGTRLSPAGGGVALPVIPRVSLPADPLAQGLSLFVPATTGEHRVAWELSLNGRPFARYEPSPQFESVTLNLMPAEDSFQGSFGYAFALKNQMRLWTDGSLPKARDPRLGDLRDEYVQSDDGYWSNRPEANRGEIRLGGAEGEWSEAQSYVLFELPRQEDVSVGALQHLATTRPYAVGNPWGGEANNVFDHYFISTIPRWSDFVPERPIPLPSPFVHVKLDGKGNVPVGNSLDPSQPDSDFLRDYSSAAKYAMIRGAFNINSTSSEAWKAVLGGSRLQAWIYGDNSTRSLEHAYFRLSHTADRFRTDPSEAPTAGTSYQRGVRVLSEAQVEAMARSVVSELRGRGSPFGSISAFLREGVIARAVAAAGANASLPESVAGSPGWLTQADVVTGIAPFIVARSDTFLIRAYGDVLNPTTGKIESRAWCEATVQRVAQLTRSIDGRMPGIQELIAPSSESYLHGRRFIVTSFRWLSPADI
ncbi:MAG TPA: hypothetical protein PLN52_19115 [Opitutaceae bacterium]|nr:hypothetical protein [Opitutaceae bacterium]